MTVNGKREAGVLCHIASLPSEYGIGSLGKEAYRFVARRPRAGLKKWQVLPLVQTGYGDSPYSSVSCDSGNPYFIDLARLKKEKLLTGAELKSARVEGDKIDYGALFQNRYPLLRKAFSRFNLDQKEFCAFVKSGIAEDYALFMTAKTVFDGLAFCEWEEGVKFRDAQAIEALRTDYHEEYLFWQFLQYQFRRQWKELKAYANGCGIQIVGDIPLYVAYDSADVWAHPELFKLDKQLKPTKVAGVPPDYFSETGQLWGNPVYDWTMQKKDGYAWWNNRLRSALETYDIVRIDHFRGFDRYYEIPAGAENAVGGQWREGPKAELFASLDKDARARIIAEDLGTIDDGVRKLLADTAFPGMKVLLFAFDGNPDNEYLPAQITENAVCYTGTHDNDTVVGYVRSLSEEGYILFRSRVAAELAREELALPLGEGETGFAGAFVAMALNSKARLAMLPVQDILGLGNEARMNMPGSEGANWQFRLKKLPKGALKGLKKAIAKFGR